MSTSIDFEPRANLRPVEQKLNGNIPTSCDNSYGNEYMTMDALVEVPSHNWAEAPLEPLSSG